MTQPTEAPHGRDPRGGHHPLTPTGARHVSTGRRAYCVICASDRREAIERDLLRGMPQAEVARRYGRDRKTVRKHRVEHMDPLEAVDLAADTSTLDKVRDLTVRLDAALTATPPGATYANLAGQLRQALELVARLTRELDERPQVAIVQAPEWHAVRSVVFEALAPYPDARAAVAAALQGDVRMPRAKALPA